MRNTNNALNAMASQFTRSQVPIRQMGDAMRQTSSLINYTMIMPLARLGTAAIQASRNFEMSMKKIQGLVGLSAKEVQSFEKDILRMASDVARSPLELADAMYFISSAGIRGAEAVDVLKESAKAAAAGLGETKVIADALTSVINAYGDGNYSAARAADVLTAAVKEGKVEADQLAPSLGKVLPIAATFGATFEDVSAGMASLTRTGTTAGTAAIYLRQVMSQLLKPAKAARDELYAAGTSAEEVRKNVQENGLLDALSMLNAKLGGTDTSLAVSGLTKVFGNVRALQAVLSLLGPNLEENRRIFDQVGMSAGDAAEAFRVYTETADYKFKQAISSSQTALIGLGNALMPFATGLMQMGTILTGVVGAFFRLAQGSSFLARGFNVLLKVIGSFGFAVFAGMKMANGLFRTWGSMVRLGGHLQTVIRGITQGIRLGGQAAQASTRAFGGLTMTTQQESVALNELTFAEQQNNLTQREALLIGARNNGSLIERRLLTMAASRANNTMTITTDQATVAIANAGTATATFGMKVMAFLPEIMVGIMLISALASMFGVFGKKNDGLDKTVKQLGDMNTFLGDAVKMDQIDVSLNLKQNKLNFTGGALDSDTKKQIEEELSKDVQSAVAEIGKRNPGSAEAAAYAASVIKRMTGLTEESKKSLMMWFQDSLSVTPGMIAQAAAGMAPLGQEMDKVGQLVQAQFITGFQRDFGTLVETGPNGGALVENYSDMFQQMIADTGTDVNDVNAVLSMLFDQGEIGDVGAKGRTVAAVVTGLGDELSTSFSQTKNLNTFLYGLKTMDGAIKDSTLSTEQQGEAFKTFTQGAFKEIKDIGGLTKESSGSFEKMFGNVDNQNGITAFFTELGVEEETAKQITGELADGYKKLGDATPIEEFGVFNDVIQKHIDASRNSISEQDRQKMAVMELADTFSTGLNPAIQALADEYEMATGAIKHFEEGQKAVLGLANDFIGSQVSLGDSIRDVKKALSEAGSGGLDPYSEKGGAAITKLQKYRDALLDTANLEAMDPAKGLSVATNTITEGYQRLVAQMVSGGKMTTDQAKKTLDSIGFNIAELQGTLIGAGAATEKDGGIDKNLLNKVSEGINANGAAAATDAIPGMKAFNDALLQQMKDYWGIKSPSKLAEEKIGKPITDGVIRGVFNPDSVRNLVEKMKHAGKNGGVGFVEGMTDGMGASEKALATETSRLAAMANFYLKNPNAGTGAQFGSSPPSSDIKNLFNTAEDAFANAGTSSSGGEKKIETKAEAAMQKVIDKFGKFSNAFAAMIDKVTKDSKSALDSIGGYINAQIRLANSMLDRQKLVIEQQGLVAAAARAERERAYATTKVGSGLGAQVTDYELSRIEELQTAYEEASRAYAMKRGTFTAMIDAEQALMEARAAASEVSPDAIKAETGVLDAKQEEKNRNLELAKATLDIVTAQEEQAASAIDLATNMDQARTIFAQFANEAIPGVATSIDDLGLKLNDANGTFQRALHAFGETVFGYIPNASTETTNQSAATDTYVTPPITPAAATTNPALYTSPNFGLKPDGSFYRTFTAAVKGLHPEYQKGIAQAKVDFWRLWKLYQSKNIPLARGGIVANGPINALIGERGPEAVIPLQGYSTQIALQKLFKVSQDGGAMGSYGSGNNVYITVNNPVAETSEESIARRMKALSTAGLFR
jgi:TP901 family phage tail tape measure protein